MELARTVAEAREIQEGLRERIVFRPPHGFSPRVVAGADVAFDKARNLAFAAVVVIDVDSLETVETATAALPISFPYVPGYLSFRELPALAAAWEGLRERPDLVVLDAHGYAHPRRMGLACHAGLELLTSGVPGHPSWIQRAGRSWAGRCARATGFARSTCLSDTSSTCPPQRSSS
jgi:deoxyinosine 3'endonuclease (endonuclease V)